MTFPTVLQFQYHSSYTCRLLMGISRHVWMACAQITSNSAQTEVSDPLGPGCKFKQPLFIGQCAVYGSSSWICKTLKKVDKN